MLSDIPTTFCLSPLHSNRTCQAGKSYDLLTGFNLLDPNVQHQVVEEITRHGTRVVGLSPPCTFFSKLMDTNWARMDPVASSLKVTDAICMLDLCVWLARWQMERGNYFFLEHPFTAKSWSRANVQALAGLPGVKKSVFDQCQFGLVTKINKDAMKKRTIILSNMESIYERFNGRLCDKQHAHVTVAGTEGGERRSTHAQRYPRELCNALAECIRKQLSTDNDN